MTLNCPDFLKYDIISAIAIVEKSRKKTEKSMSIVTKRGDNGQTSLYCGGRVMKDHIRIEACGDLDELCSYLGMSKCLTKDKKEKELIVSVQKDLFVIGSEIATPANMLARLKKKIDSDDVRRVEKALERIETKSQHPRRAFAIPGKDSVSSVLDIARAVTRRVERRTVTLRNKQMLKNTHILVYLNRLSDLLYLLARNHEKINVKKEKRYG